MRRTRVWRLWLWLAACSMAGTPCIAAPRVAVLEVRAGQAGTACFTITEAQERLYGAPQFDAISVTEAFTPRVALWTMTMPRERTFPVSFRMCIPYAGRLPVLPQTRAAPLEAGRVYDVIITPRAPPATAPRQYRARFCLYAGSVRQLPLHAAACTG